MILIADARTIHLSGDFIEAAVPRPARRLRLSRAAAFFRLALNATLW